MDDVTAISRFDAMASEFDRHRALPSGVAEAARAMVMGSITSTSRPHILDLGAGTGRFGHAFVAAGDEYVGVDLSFGMLRQFMSLTERGGTTVRLVRADGQCLPFQDAAFDVVMLIQTFGGLRSWGQVLVEARRVLRPAGVMVVGRTVRPSGGVDSRMKQRLRLLLNEEGVELGLVNASEDVGRWLEATGRGGGWKVVASWNTDRTPRGFLDRQRTGAQFHQLPQAVKDQALIRLGAWAVTTFGSVDAVSSERHSFELQFYRFS
jgi:ubiquinone/menaquinone biosynthesis C-methylase UbiE